MYRSTRGSRKSQEKGNLDKTRKTVDNKKAYLMSINGVGPKTADCLIEQFSENAADFLAENQGVERPSYITAKRWKHLLAFLRDKSTFAIVARQLSKYNLTNGMIRKIVNRYGKSADEIIKENPYRLVYEVEGIGFQTVDTRIARYLGIDEHDQRRIRALILYLMYVECENGGHVYSTIETLAETNRKRRIDTSDVTKEEWMTAIFYLSGTRSGKYPMVIREGERLYLSYNYRFEKSAAAALGKFLDNDDILISDDIDRDIEDYNESLGAYRLDEDQEAAIRQIMSHRFNILTGGPGTGKTTIIGGIVQILQDHGLTVHLAAPTGRAAKRMTESTGVAAETIHRMLGYDGTSFARDQSDPLRYDAIIVDESSMIDLRLFYSLLRAINPENTCLLFVGDVDQLPSVGAGRVLTDLIHSGCFSVVRLTKIHRQADDSHICDNAQKINRGMFPKKADDFRMITYHRNSERLHDLIENIVLGCSDPDVQILAATNNTVDDINRMVQTMKNPPSPDKKEIVICEKEKTEGKGKEKKQKEWIYREGDKIMQLRNCYDAELYHRKEEKKEKETDTLFGMDSLRPDSDTTSIYNGDIGVIQKIIKDTDTIVVRFDGNRDVSYCQNTLCADTRLAYAMTIHKSQGSEFDSAILILPPSSRRGFVTRKLVYTAVTRAKKQVFILGDTDVIMSAISDTTEKERRSYLTERIQAEAKSGIRHKKPRVKVRPQVLTEDWHTAQKPRKIILFPGQDHHYSYPAREQAR